jgi:hypothetical protein
MTKDHKILYVISLINLVRDLSEKIDDNEFKSLMNEYLDDDRLTELIIMLELNFLKD